VYKYLIPIGVIYVYSYFILRNNIKNKIDTIVTDNALEDFIALAKYSDTTNVKTVSETLTSRTGNCLEFSLVYASNSLHHNNKPKIVLMLYIGLKKPFIGLHATVMDKKSLVDLTEKITIEGRFKLIKYILFAVTRAKTLFIPIYIIPL